MQYLQVSRLAYSRLMVQTAFLILVLYFDWFDFLALNHVLQLTNRPLSTAQLTNRD